MGRSFEAGRSGRVTIAGVGASTPRLLKTS